MKPTSIVLHHTAGAAGNVATIRQQHKARGWKDIAYHFVICNGKGGADGEIQVGRPADQNGAGVYGNNRDRLQIALVGNFHKPDPGYTGPPTPKQLRSLGAWLVEHGKKRRIPTAKVHGHREIALPGHGTACPGSEFPLDRIREWYANYGDVPLPESLDEFLGNDVPAAPFLLLIDGREVTKPAGATLDGGTTRVECALKDLCQVMDWGIRYLPEQNRTIVETRSEP